MNQLEMCNLTPGCLAVAGDVVCRQPQAQVPAAEGLCWPWQWCAGSSSHEGPPNPCNGLLQWGGASI